jgi:hypothetical protein
MLSSVRRPVVAVAVVLLALTGCAAQTSSATPAPGGPGPAAGTTAAVTGSAGVPTDLVGLWQLVADGEAPGTALRLGSDLSLWRSCHLLRGGWRASADGGFLGEADDGWSYGCGGPKATAAPKPEQPAPAPAPWLLRATGYRVDGVDRLLVDAGGRTVARLSPGGHPAPNPNVAADLSAPPKLDAALRAELAPAKPLPSALAPAKPGDLVGNWSPEKPGKGPRQPFVKLAADGSWGGSDGCNSNGGRWTYTPAGTLLSMSGPSTLIGCEGQDVAPRMPQVGRAGLAGHTLVILDAKGNETARLIRS